MCIAVGQTRKCCCFQALQNGLSLPEVFGQCVHHPHGAPLVLPLIHFGFLGKSLPFFSFPPFSNDLFFSMVVTIHCFE